MIKVLLFDVLNVPKALGAVKSDTSVQVVPFQDSVKASIPGPGGSTSTAKAAVCVPNACKIALALFILFTSVQVVPL
jgi:hypothetical protein